METAALPPSRSNEIVNSCQNPSHQDSRGSDVIQNEIGVDSNQIPTSPKTIDKITDPYDAGNNDIGADHGPGGRIPDLPDTDEMYLLDQKPPTTATNYGPGQQNPQQNESRLSRHHDDDDDDDEPMRTIRIGDDETRRMYTSNMVNTSKYTSWNFIPKCVFEQFSRVANVYFLVVSMVQVTTRLSPTSQFATLIPLICVMSVSLVKEFVEDWIRHEADDGVNFSEVDVVNFGGCDGVYTRRVFSSDVRVGDVLQIHDGQSIPADSILLSTCTSSGIGFIETSNLDGENNLKFRQSLACTCKIDSARSASKLRGTVSCDVPNANIYRFRGTIMIDGQSKTYTINHNNMILRGAALRSTETAYVLVIYTGADCKQSLNAVPARSKLSNVERLVNQIIIFILMAIATFCGCMSLGFVLWSMSNINAWYLPFIASMSIQDQLNSLITFLILFNNLVPISLYLTLEVVKFTQAKLIENDLKMFHSAKKYRAFARTSALNEDLGQIAYVFSDKTGTLTRNHMTFKRVSIEGRVYASMHISTKPGKHRLPDYQNFTSTNPDTRARGTSKSRTNDRLLKGNMLIMHLKSKRPQAVAIRDTLRIMSVCHTVIPERHNSEHGVVLKYKAISADEEALVRGAFTYGYELEHRDAKTLGICALGDHQKFRILNTNEFSSRRAMMSMVVLTPEKELVLYCKGSDAVILDRLSSEQKQSSSLQATRNHLHYFAVNGLRTLALAKVALDLDFYQEWNARYQLALQGGADANTMENIASDIEKNLELVAVTAIEDQLQDQVADAIRTMTGAGIKFWMLTGDKVETAVNIGRSCSLISSDMRKLELTATSMDMIQDTLSTYYNKILDESYAMIIDGLAFEPILINPQLSKMFFEICSKCAVVIACRVTPRQKAAFVRGIRLLNGNKPTLAIGDGANDVQMLQEADIGVGIIGNEGMQAVRASDFAIGQFRYLSRLLLVHGTWSYRRVSKVILFSFYKNVTMVLTLLYYCMLTGYSGSSLYNAWLSSGWNVAFTFLPVITFGVLDRDLEVNIIMKFPKVYHRGQQRLLFNVKVFFRYMIVAIIHSVIAFGFCIGSATDEWIGDMSLLGTLINGCLVFLVNCKIALETRYWTLLHLAAILSSVILWFIFIFIYSSLELGDFYGMALVLFLNPLTWFSFIFVTCSVIGLELAWQFIKHELFPDPCDVAREIKQFDCIDDPDNQSVEADNNSNDELMPLNETPLHSSDPNGSAAVGSDLFMNSFAFSYPTLESATQRQEEKEFRERNRTQKRNRRSSTTSTARRDKSRSYHEEPVFIINGPTVEALAYLQQQVEEEESYAREMSTRNGSAANSFKKSKHKS